MTGPIRLDPERISILDSNVFTRLCNALLRAEAGRCGIPQQQVDTTVRDKAPDGGIDCLVTGAPAASGPWIPGDGSAYQLKSGAAPTPGELTRELRKPESQAAFSRGDAYVLVLAEPISARRKRKRLEQIDEEYIRRGLPGRGRVWTADQVAAWVEQHPAIAASTFGLPLAGWVPFDGWAARAPFRTRWSPGPAQEEVIRRIAAAIGARTQLIQVEGRPGAGRTRTVLEALRPDGLRQRVLYAAEPAAVHVDFFWHLRGENAQGRGLLVVDQCTPDDVARIREISDPLPPGFTLVTIGSPHPGARGGDAIQLRDADENALVSLLESVAPGIPHGARRAVAERCGGSPKLAVLVGTHLAGRPGVAEWDQVEGSPDLARYLNTIFPRDRHDAQGMVVRAVSLFRRLGWRDGVAAEGRATVELLGVGWPEAQLAANRLMDAGVLSRRGRYLHVTPDLLANHLARDTLQAYGPDVVSRLFPHLSDAARTSFAERLRMVGDGRRTRVVAEKILREAGFFSGVQALEGPRVSRLVLLLAPAFPETVGGQLHRALGTAPRDALLALTKERQRLVWALQQLTWREDRFPVVARLLLRLAWAENSTLRGGATDTWTSLFQVLPGGTAIPFAARLPVLDEALAADDPEVRRLGVLALGVALRNQMIPLDFPPLDTGVLPPAVWEPESRAAYGEIVRLCLHRLGDALDDADDAVRQEAVQVAATCGQDLVTGGLAAPWAHAVRRLKGRPFALRWPVLSVVEQALRFSRGTDAGEGALLEELRRDLHDGSFSDRLRTALASGADVAVPASAAVRGALEALAREALGCPRLLEEELDWLLDDETAGALELGELVGRGDDGDALVSVLAGKCRAGARGAGFLCGYFAGAAERRGTGWLESLLDGWAAEPGMAPCIAAVSARAPASDRAARRVAALMSRGALPGSVAGRLADASWGGGVSPEALAELLDAAAQDGSPEAVRGRTLLLLQRLQDHPEQLPALRGAVERALQDGSSLRHRRPVAQAWTLLARTILPDARLGVARMCLAAFEANEDSLAWLRPDADPRRFLAEVLRTGPREVFREVVGPALVRDPALARTLTSASRGQTLLREVEPQVVVEWVAEDPDARLPPASAAVPVVAWTEEEAVGYPTDRLSPIARALLVRFGHVPALGEALSRTLWDIIYLEPRSRLVAQWLDVFATWTQDAEPGVREWALTLDAPYRRFLEHLQDEEEEGGR